MPQFVSQGKAAACGALEIIDDDPGVSFSRQTHQASFKCISRFIANFADIELPRYVVERQRERRVWNKLNDFGCEGFRIA